MYISDTWKDKHLWFYIIIVVLIAVLSSIIIIKGMNTDEYKALNKPDWQPAPVAFMIIWTILYILIIYAWYKSDRGSYPGNQRTTVNILFGINLLLNLLWVYLFFGNFDLNSALIVMVLLIISTIALIWYIYRIHPKSAMLLLFYLLWLIIAMFLNSSYVSLNPEITN